VKYHHHKKMKKRQIQGFGLVAVSLALVVALIGAVSYVVLLSDEVFKSSPNEVEPQPPIPVNLPHSGGQTLTEEERTKAIELAINDPEVKEWLGKGYEIYEVVPFPTEYEGIRMCMVYILTNEQKPPWVPGITLEVFVDWNQEKVYGFDFYLKLASLTETQKEEVMSIALADPAVLEMIEDKEYEIQGVRVDYWETFNEEKRSFHAYPAVRIKVDPDPGALPTIIYVDLESKEVVKISSPFKLNLPTSPISEYSTHLVVVTPHR